MKQTVFYLANTKTLKKLYFHQMEQNNCHINRRLNSKYDHRFKPPILCYFIDWEGDHPSCEPFYLLINYQAALDNYHAKTLIADGPHILLCQILDCQWTDSSRSSA